MHNKTMKLSLVSLAALLIFAIAACGDKPEPEGQDRPAAQQPEQQAEKPATPPNPEQPPREETPVVKQGQGSFTGLADPHTVEIIVDGSPMAFQFGEKLKSAVEAIAPDQQVEFKYEEKAIEGDASLKQLVLTEISKAGSGQ
ncbi:MULTISPECIES: hypothetical protein [Paenibacillus]|uniref:Uncharacterized protein n=1 Tax=Paenibacillus albilobatus TaxID=2716884 RepID=A0A919XEE1_9BACL|nr:MULTISPECIES: hypothetical protein [Paenibacillus]GIO29475.1 hypothetical protein J2TS6_06160 [Paenibacillus albilobatus]